VPVCVSVGVAIGMTVRLRAHLEDVEDKNGWLREGGTSGGAVN
jgi:hypothetical protein